MPTLPPAHTTAPGLPRHVGSHNRYRQNRLTQARQQKRALPTNCKAWRDLRAKVLRSEPLCRICREQGRITEATEVDHIDGDASTMESNALDNLRPLCNPCHSSVTASQQKI